MTVLAVAPSSRWSGIACLDAEGRVLACKTRWLRGHKTPAKKTAALRREVELLISRFHPRLIAIEHGRPGLKSAGELPMVRALLACARERGISAVGLSRCAAAKRMTGGTSWAVQLAALRVAHDFLREEIPEGSRRFFRLSERFRGVRLKYVALSIAHVLVRDGLLPHLPAR